MRKETLSVNLFVCFFVVFSLVFFNFSYLVCMLIFTVLPSGVINDRLNDSCSLLSICWTANDTYQHNCTVSFIHHTNTLSLSTPQTDHPRYANSHVSDSSSQLGASMTTRHEQNRKNNHYRYVLSYFFGCGQMPR